MTARQLVELDRLADLVACALQLAREPPEPLVGVGVLRLGAPEMRADELEVLGELPEVAVELGDVAHHLLSTLLDLHTS